LMFLTTMACTEATECITTFGNPFRYFFFQAEDGIRNFHVTGVQTCALRSRKDKQWRKRFEVHPCLSWNLLHSIQVCWSSPRPVQIGRASCRERVKAAEGGESHSTRR